MCRYRRNTKLRGVSKQGRISRHPYRSADPRDAVSIRSASTHRTGRHSRRPLRIPPVQACTGTCLQRKKGRFSLPRRYFPRRTEPVKQRDRPVPSRRNGRKRRMPHVFGYRRLSRSAVVSAPLSACRMEEREPKKMKNCKDRHRESNCRTEITFSTGISAAELRKMEADPGLPRP